ncbi:hypothetical protein [Calidifontibacillus oryziterrae]|uniref:hypothetical protein n=1 Tax=Calidifontibacillus oryziterrae TaxID=1191699 RepID=UPI000305DD87|nr:hypothetical protein [Calidifontibacillus oryziterrae]
MIVTTELLNLILVFGTFILTIIMSLLTFGMFIIMFIEFIKNRPKKNKKVKHQKAA